MLWYLLFIVVVIARTAWFSAVRLTIQITVGARPTVKESSHESSHESSLRQFHPGATVDLSGKRGAFACLRARSPQHAEILFRFHADFNLAAMSEGAWVADEFESLNEKLREDIKGLTEELEDFEELEGLSEEIEPLKKHLSEHLRGKKELAGLYEKIAALDLKLDAQFRALEQAFDKRFGTLGDTLASQLDETLASREKHLTMRLNALSGQVTQLTAVYLTPTYFTGRLLINRESGQVQAFSLAIPEHDGNVTLSTFGRVDTVFVPRMKLISESTDEQTGISWATALASEEAHLALHAAARGEKPPRRYFTPLIKSPIREPLIIEPPLTR